MWRSHTGQYAALDAGLTKDQIRARAMARGVYLMAMTLAYWAMWQRDEEEYYGQRRELREDNFILPGPDGTMFRLPIPFEVGVVYKAIPELFLNALNGKEDRIVPGLLRQMKMSAGVSVVPQAIEPAVDAFRNRNSFTGNPIVPFYMESGTQRREQYTHETNRLAVEVGESLNLSPQKVEYLMTNYFPGIGLYAFSVADMIARAARGETAVGTRSDLGSPLSYPLIRGVTAKAGGGFQQDFYDLQKEVTQLVGSLNRLKKEGKVDDFRARREASADLYSVRGRVNSLQRYMDRWHERRSRLLMLNGISDTERRDRLHALEEERDRELSVVPLLREVAAGKKKP
jgi:hypothetical protein